MGFIASHMATVNRRLLTAGLLLLLLAAVPAYFGGATIAQAFRGPRPLTEQELLAIQQPDGGGHYVSLSLARPAVDSGVRYGKKNNPGTKYLLLPVGGRVLLCSARMSAEGNAFTGRLQAVSGTDKEVRQRIEGANSGLAPLLLPYMLQSVSDVFSFGPPTRLFTPRQIEADAGRPPRRFRSCSRPPHGSARGGAWGA
jgi:hypothetical protein